MRLAQPLVGEPLRIAMPLRLLAAMMLASMGAGPPIVVPLASVTWMPSPTLPRLVAADRPVDCAGSYRLEARGITLFEAISSEDHSSITGLPLIALTTILREIGFVIP